MDDPDVTSPSPVRSPTTWIDALLAFSAGDDVVARALIVSVTGPTPRAVGATALISAGRHAGRVGRPEVMASVLGEARALIEHRRTLTGDAQQWLRRTFTFKTGPVLGENTSGEIVVLIEAFAEPELKVLAALPAPALALCRPLTPGTAPQASPAELPGHEPLGFGQDGSMLVERLATDNPTFHVYGTGALASALVDVLAALPFAVVWHDTSPDHYPASMPRGVAIEPGQDLPSLAATAGHGAAHAVMTSNHQLDLAIASAVLNAGDFGYLGVIGSRLKAKRLRDRLRSEGIPETALTRLSCPIGLPELRSKDPAVIAVSIAAEALIALRNSNPST